MPRCKAELSTYGATCIHATNNNGFPRLKDEPDSTTRMPNWTATAAATAGVGNASATGSAPTRVTVRAAMNGALVLAKMGMLLERTLRASRHVALEIANVLMYKPDLYPRHGAVYKKDVQVRSQRPSRHTRDENTANSVERTCRLRPSRNAKTAPHSSHVAFFCRSWTLL
jgi:hypothetical protein